MAKPQDQGAGTEYLYYKTNNQIINDMEKKFIKVLSVRDIVIFTSLIITGAVLIALPTGASINITGFFMIVAGIILAFTLRSGYKDTETGQRYMKKEHFFHQAMSSQLSSAIADKPESVDMSERDKGNTMRLDIYFSNLSGKAYIQLFEYVPYKYEPCSRMYEHEVVKVRQLINS